MDRTWPDRLVVVRHGESAGNVARDAAEAGQLERIELSSRDVDVPLSPRGEQQAADLGRRLAADPPTVLWVSPYLRARQTAEIALRTAGLDIPRVVDERLREREFGVLDGLTRLGITTQYPQESQRRAVLGKFYHRPPGGESWTDALLRVRSALDDVRRDCVGERVLLVAHQVVVLLVRYVVEGLDEEQVLAVDALGDVGNCALTTYELVGGSLALTAFNDADHLARATAEPDAPVAVR